MALPSGAVTGLDTCVRKPLVATTAADCAVRIWNWQDATLELVKQFQDEAVSVALHPSGQLLLVGFADKLRLFTVLMDDLKVCRCCVPMSVASSCSVLRYCQLSMHCFMCSVLHCWAQRTVLQHRC